MANEQITLHKSADRKAEAWVDGDAIIIAESEAYTPHGHSRRKWAEQRIALSKEEIAKLAQWAAGAQDRSVER